MTHDEVLALVREVADPRWADPVCSMSDMVTLTLDEMIAFADRAAVEAERERIVADGWRQCAKGQRTTQFCGQLQKAVEAEQARCLKEIELRMPSEGIIRATLQDVRVAIKRGAA